MRFQVREIVLWPRLEGLGPRRVKFTMDKVNVISGASKTGKSSVIPIIDYCLGADRCSVPVGPIRDACSWFGIVVDTSDGQKLLARREPGGQQSTGDMFLAEGRAITVPSTIEKNTTSDAVKRTLDRLSGLSNLPFEPESTSNFKARPSFRDLLAFCFQPQNVVANPDVMFFRAEAMEHREKLRTVFPYVLGAVTPEALAAKWELDQLQRELRRKEEQQTSQLRATETWKAELRTWLTEARDLGLVEPQAVAEVHAEKQLIEQLKAVVRKRSDESRVTAQTIVEAASEGAQLVAEESRVALELGHLHHRLEGMLTLRKTVDAYSGALIKQRERLQLSRWLRGRAKIDERCPICGGRYDEPLKELRKLSDALAEVEASARQMSAVPASFDRELAEVRENARVLTDRMNSVRVRMKAAQGRSSAARDAALRTASVERFLGRAEQALKYFAPAEPDTVLADEIAKLRSRIEELRRIASAGQVKARTQAALERVSGYIARLMPELDSERPDDPVHLDLSELMVKIAGGDGREDYLWEIGSGANWLAYHVATIVALQKLFTELRQSPVPQFVVFDQPSQVYFPRTLAHDMAEGEDPDFRDEDVVAIRKVFACLARAIADVAGLQVIVLDHAGRDIWGSLENVTLVEEWRGRGKLVPAEWLRTRHP